MLRLFACISVLLGLWELWSTVITVYLLDFLQREIL